MIELSEESKNGINAIVSVLEKRENLEKVTKIIERASLDIYDQILDQVKDWFLENCKDNFEYHIMYEVKKLIRHILEGNYNDPLALQITESYDMNKVREKLFNDYGNEIQRKIFDDLKKENQDLQTSLEYARRY